MNKEELDLLEIVCTLAIGEWVFNDINDIQKLEDKIKAIDNLCKKQKEVIDKAIEYIRIYRSYQKIDNKDYLKGRDEIGCLDIYQVDELLDILKEVSE